MMTIAEKYREDGRKHGMCDKVYDEITSDTSREELVEKWMANIDFAIHTGYPSVGQMKEDFGDIMHGFGVYADEKVEEYDRDLTVLNGRCEAHLNYGNKCGRIYVRHDSKAYITAVGSSRVFVSVYDDADVDVHTGVFAKVFVYQYGRGKVKANSDRVVVRDRREL